MTDINRPALDRGGSATAIASAIGRPGDAFAEAVGLVVRGAHA